MAHVIMTEYNESPLKGQEVSRAVTFVLTPPLFAYAVVAYNKTPYGIKVMGEVPAQNAPKELKRYRPIAKKASTALESLKGADEYRLIAITQPSKTGLKKTPEVLEIALGGSKEEAFEMASGLLGKEISAKDVYKEGDITDVVAVTTGRGWQGVVKRFGVALNPRKATGARRHGGSLGGETQAKVMYTLPRAGQTGFHRRTERNKRILAISDDPAQYQPKGGFPHFGLLKGTFMMFEGSLPGPAKRLIRFRKPLQPHGPAKIEVKQVIV